MNTKGLAHASKTAGDHAARVAARKVDPEPYSTEPAATIAPPDMDAVTAAANEAAETAREKVLAAAREANQVAIQEAENAKQQAAANAYFLDMINKHNAAAMEAYRLELDIVKAIVRRKGDRIRIGEGGQLLNQIIGNLNDFESARRPKILIVECLGTEV